MQNKTILSNYIQKLTINKIINYLESLQVFY